MQQNQLLPFYLSLALFGCDTDKGNDYTINRLLPKIVSDSETLEFGDIVVLYDADMEFNILNAGRAPLEISSITVEGNNDGVYTILPETAELAVDETLTVGVNFKPATYLPYNRDLVITSNDEENPEFRIPIQGEGIDGPVPDIDITPQVIDFGLVNQGVTATQYFQLSNVGTGVLEITDVQLEGSGEFEIVNGFANSAYQQDQSTTIITNYTPTAEGGANAIIKITTNDPDEENVEITLLGNGGGEFEYPVADFNCPSQVDPPTTLNFDGGNSTDPAGNLPLTYNWELVSRPSISHTDFDDSDNQTSPFFVDIAGDYTVQLTVTNSIGLSSEPTQCSFNATPDESVHVELSWNTGNSDFDLHFVQYSEGDYPMFTYDHDCCWCNPNPAWGASGTSDDPSLSLDNRVGYGPEAVHIETPSEGTYGVFVHYFDDKGGGLTTATVRIYIDGTMIEETGLVMDERDLWYVGDIFWVGGNGSFYLSEEDVEAGYMNQCHED